MKRFWNVLFVFVSLSLSIFFGCTHQDERVADIKVRPNYAFIGKTVRLVYSDTIANLVDPHVANTALTLQVAHLLYPTLMTLDSDTAIPVPYLARSYVMTQNEKTGRVTYTFTLHDAQWSDGSFITAWNVKASLLRLLSNSKKHPYAMMIALSDTATYDAYNRALNGTVTPFNNQADAFVIKILSDKTFSITVSTSAIPLLRMLASPASAVLPISNKQNANTVDTFLFTTSDFDEAINSKKEIIYGGPYILKSRKDDILTFVPNRFFWSAKKKRSIQVILETGSSRWLEPSDTKNNISVSSKDAFNTDILKKHTEQRVYSYALISCSLPKNSHIRSTVAKAFRQSKKSKQQNQTKIEEQAAIVVLMRILYRKLFVDPHRALKEQFPQQTLYAVRPAFKSIFLPYMVSFNKTVNSDEQKSDNEEENSKKIAYRAVNLLRTSNTPITISFFNEHAGNKIGEYEYADTLVFNALQMIVQSAMKSVGIRMRIILDPQSAEVGDVVFLITRPYNASAVAIIAALWRQLMMIKNTTTFSLSKEAQTIGNLIRTMTGSENSNAYYKHLNTISTTLMQTNTVIPIAHAGFPIAYAHNAICTFVRKGNRMRREQWFPLIAYGLKK